VSGSRVGRRPMSTLQTHLNAIRSERVIVVIRRGGEARKVLQVIFSNEGVFVNFPYFQHRVGLIAEATLPPDGSVKASVDLTLGGKVTSHLVKYSHHVDGRAHFSQDGKVRTEVRRQALPLDLQQGHMFTTLIQGLVAFDKAHSTRDSGSTPKRAVVNFDLESSPVSCSVKVVGRWYDVAKLRSEGEAPPTIGPIVPLKDGRGREYAGVALASPDEGSHHVLLITCENVPSVGPEPESLLFLGGFDAPEVVKDPSRASRFLAFVYPTAAAETLASKLGSVDLRPAAAT
jgi:hypothetical protein